MNYNTNAQYIAYLERKVRRLEGLLTENEESPVTPEMIEKIKSMIKINVDENNFDMAKFWLEKWGMC